MLSDQDENHCVLIQTGELFVKSYRDWSSYDRNQKPYPGCAAVYKLNFYVSSHVIFQAIPCRFPISIYKSTSESPERSPSLPTFQTETETKPQRFASSCCKGTATFLPWPPSPPAAAGCGLGPQELARRGKKRARGPL